MPWKMNKNSALKRKQAENLFAEGLGAHRISRALDVNFYTVRDWQCAWKNKQDKRTQGNTLINRSLAENLFNCGYGYRAVSRMLRLSSVWIARDWARRYRRLSSIQSRRRRKKTL